MMVFGNYHIFLLSDPDSKACEKEDDDGWSEGNIVSSLKDHKKSVIAKNGIENAQ